MKRLFLVLSASLLAVVAMAQDKCLQLGDSIVKYQSRSGGWCKNQNWLAGADPVAMRACRASGIGATIDNGATVSEMRCLVKAIDRVKEMADIGLEGIDVKALNQRAAVYNAAFVRGLEYLLKMQYDNGGFPQFYPPKRKSDYSVHITFNDNAMTNALLMLSDVARNDGALRNVDVDDRMRRKCERAYEKGLQCILDCQIRVGDDGRVLEYGTEEWKNGRRTVWCQQHDKATLAPVKARAYELPSYSGFGETCAILSLLMDVENPSAEIKGAVRDAVQWLEQHAMKDVVKESFVNDEGKNDIRIAHKSGAPLMWARFYDLENALPFYCDRDGVPRRELSEIGYERRNGYSWVSCQPSKIIERYKNLNY